MKSKTSYLRLYIINMVIILYTHHRQSILLSIFYIIITNIVVRLLSCCILTSFRVVYNIKRLKQKEEILTYAIMAQSNKDKQS